MKGIEKAQVGIITVLTVMLVSITRRLPEARRLSSGITTLTLAGIVLLVAVGSASAATQITSCNFNANQDGERYYLDADLNCGSLAAGEYGVKVTASNVIIDGQGNTIMATVDNVACQGTTETGPEGGVCGILVRGNLDNITINDIEIKDFCTGIGIKGTNAFNPVTNVTVINCSIHDNGVPGALATTGTTHGIHLVYADDCTITKNNIVETNRGGANICDCGSGGNGIFVHTSNDNTITCNNLCDNEKAGIFMKKGSSRNKIQYNNASGNGHSGVCIRCKSSNYNEIEYNNASYNKGTGIFIRGQHNAARYNTVLNNMNGSWYATNCGTGDPSYEVTAFGVGIKGSADTYYGELSNNTVCENEVWDVYDPQSAGTGGFTAGDCNTGGSSGGVGDYRDASAPAPPGHPFVYTCTDLMSVYFDFDGDTHYSPASCICGNELGVGTCCNPGLFNESHANMLNGTIPPICWLTPGDDPNDCLAYTATGALFESDGITPLTGATATMKNLKTGVQWNAVVEGNTYTVKVDPVLDISAGNMLRITAKNVSDAEGWTDHKVHTCDIALEGFTADVIIDNYILNYYPCYPYYIQEEDDWSGPAVMRACIAHYIDPPSQAVLNETGIGNNHPGHPDLLYVDPLGMEATMDSYLHPTGHNYGVFALSDVEDALHRICYWQKLGPGAVPAYGGYSNWMAIRGIRTNKTPTDYSAPYDYDVHGFWVNDPKDPGGIGENTYKTATDFTNTYYVPTVDNVPEWDNKYMSVLEPPEQDAEVRIVPVRTRFASPVEPAVTEATLEVNDTKRPVLEIEIKDDDLLKIVKAAIDGVTEELVPYDAEFASVFAKTVAGKPMFVAGDNDYCIVPFDLPAKRIPVPIKEAVVEIRKFDDGDRTNLVKKIDFEPIPVEPTLINEKGTLVVVLVDAEDGSFKEASWVADPVKYLPVSDKEALKLVFDEKASISTTRPMIELVHRDASPYHPDWMITIGNDVYFVSQDGTVSRK